MLLAISKAKFELDIEQLCSKVSPIYDDDSTLTFSKNGTVCTDAYDNSTRNYSYITYGKFVMVPRSNHSGWLLLYHQDKLYMVDD